MSITTLAGVAAGLQIPQVFSKTNFTPVVGVPTQSYWFRQGTGGIGVADTTTAGGVARSSTSALVAGQIPFFDPASNNSYIARFSAGLASAGVGASSSSIWLFDRLWDCGSNNLGIALSPILTISQAINSAAWPARDNTGTTNGAGILIALEVSTVMGAGTPGFTLTYTNSANVGSQTSANIFTALTASAVGTFYPFGLVAGDVGVRSVESVQADATWTSGQYVLVAYRVLTHIDCPVGRSGAVDALISGFPRLYNGTVPFIVMGGGTTGSANAGCGSLQITQG